MEVSAKEDIEAPIDFVFDQITDFAGLERSVMRRGATVERLKGDGSAAVGTKWRVEFRMRGKDRKVEAELSQVDRPNGLTADLTSSQVDGQTQVELVALSRARTRLSVKVDLAPKSLQAKLLFQSLKFARQRTTGRFKTLVANFAEDVEKRYRG